MVNVPKLKAKLTEKELTQEKLAYILDMNPSTLNKKINNENGECLSIGEATKLKEILDIKEYEVIPIFFAE